MSVLHCDVRTALRCTATGDDDDYDDDDEEYDNLFGVLLTSSST